MREPRSHRLVLLIVLVVALGVTSCLGSATPADPGCGYAISVISGSGQSATAGTALSVPLEVQAGPSSEYVDVCTVPTAQFSWSVTSGGGSVVTQTSPLGANASRVTWTLGPSAGTQTVTAMWVDHPPTMSTAGSQITFTAVAK